MSKVRALFARLLKRRNEPTTQPAKPRHRPRRDPYAPLRYDGGGSPIERWLRGDYDQIAETRTDTDEEDDMTLPHHPISTRCVPWCTSDHEVDDYETRGWLCAAPTVTTVPTLEISLSRYTDPRLTEEPMISVLREGSSMLVTLQEARALAVELLRLAAIAEHRP